MAIYPAIFEPYDKKGEIKKKFEENTVRLVNIKEKSDKLFVKVLKDLNYQIKCPDGKFLCYFWIEQTVSKNLKHQDDQVVDSNQGI